ncbi:MAG TPA: outer membrane beta-barrel protein [Longimicrobiaceae bacterium]
MSFLIRRIAPAFVLLLCAGHAAAQSSGPYAGVALGATRLESPGPGFEVGRAPLRSVTLGYATAGGVFFEARAATLRERTTETIPAGQMVEAPYTLGLRATFVEAAAGWRPARLRLGPVQPVASVGAGWARVVDTWESDVPGEGERRTSQPTLSAGLGLEAALTPHVALVTCGSWRYVAESAERPSRRIGIEGTAWEVGLQLRR